MVRFEKREARHYRPREPWVQHGRGRGPGKQGARRGGWGEVGSWHGQFCMPVCPPVGSGLHDCYLLSHPSSQSHKGLHFTKMKRQVQHHCVTAKSPKMLARPCGIGGVGGEAEASGLGVLTLLLCHLSEGCCSPEDGPGKRTNPGPPRMK